MSLLSGSSLFFFGIYEPLQEDKIKKFAQLHRAVEPACDVAGRSSLPLRFLALMAQPSSPAAAHVLPALLHVGISYWTNSKNAAVLCQRAVARHDAIKTASDFTWGGGEKKTLQWQNKQTENNLKMGNSILRYFPALSLSPIQKQANEKSNFKGGCARACSNWISVTTQ